MAEEEAVKMAALKKAYAEIILNASKEAAARVMAADRKALRLEQDLFALKEESLHMLLRLKHMLDSKISEAEVKSLSQQRKIEELEAQLSEAEGIILDLREELRQVQDDLEREKYNQIPPLSNHGTMKEGTDVNASEDDEDKQPPLKNQIIGETAIERHPTIPYLASESPTQVSEANIYQCQVIKPHPGEPTTPCQPPSAFDDQVKSCKEPCSSSSSDSDEKGGKIYSEGHHVEPIEDANCCSQSMRPSGRRPRKNIKYHEAIAALRRSSRGPRAKAPQQPFLAQCSTFSIDVDAKSEVNGIHPRSRSDDSSLGVEMNDNHDTACNTGKVSSDKLIFEKEEGGEVGKAGASSYDMDSLLGDPNLLDILVSKGAKKGASNQADNDKTLKYNFQRKRKKEALARLDENIVPKMNGVKWSNLEKQRETSLMNGSILKDEPSKDSQGVLQVACRLVSLSGDRRS